MHVTLKFLYIPKCINFYCTLWHRRQFYSRLWPKVSHVHDQHLTFAAAGENQWILEKHFETIHVRVLSLFSRALSVQKWYLLTLYLTLF